MTGIMNYVPEKISQPTDFKAVSVDVTNRSLCGILIQTFRQEEVTIYGLFYC